MIENNTRQIQEQHQLIKQQSQLKETLRTHFESGKEPTRSDFHAPRHANDFRQPRTVNDFQVVPPEEYPEEQSEHNSSQVNEQLKDLAQQLYHIIERNPSYMRQFASVYDTKDMSLLSDNGRMQDFIDFALNLLSAHSISQQASSRRKQSHPDHDISSPLQEMKSAELPMSLSENRFGFGRLEKIHS